MRRPFWPPVQDSSALTTSFVTRISANWLGFELVKLPSFMFRPTILTLNIGDNWLSGLNRHILLRACRRWKQVHTRWVKWRAGNLLQIWKGMRRAMTECLMLERHRGLVNEFSDASQFGI